MIETPNFSYRLDAALAMNGLDNPTFASYFGPTGQQTVNRWRARGHIGGPSADRARQLLPRTNFEWLQKGIGPAERLIGEVNPSQLNDVRQSYAARPDVPMLAKALGVLEAAEFRNGGKFRALDAATRLLGYYDRLVMGESQGDLIAQLFDDDEQGRSDNAKQGQGSGYRPRE